jgi:hypothetical protein
MVLTYRQEVDNMNIPGDSFESPGTNNPEHEEPENMSYTPTILFVCRMAGIGGYVDISGQSTDRPVVYLVPVSWYKENIAGKLPAGMTTHSFDDYTGRTYAVNAEFQFSDRKSYKYSTGNAVDYSTYNPPSFASR